MWLSRVARDFIPAVISAVCPCGRRLHSSGGSNTSLTYLLHHCKRGKKAQRSAAGGNHCCCTTLRGLSAEDLLLTKYMVYGTDPAFKKPNASLSVYRRWVTRNGIQLPLPRFLCTAPHKEHLQLGHCSEHKSSSEEEQRNPTRLSPTDMPSTITDLKQDSVESSSPTKRKLSPQKSPVSKVLKQDQGDKMPSSVPSSPLKESQASNVTTSPSKVFKRQLEAAFGEDAATPKLQFAKLSDKAHIPTKGSQYAAGFDLKSAYAYTVPKRGSCLVKTDIQIKVPEGTYGRVAPRSGLALKNKIDVGAGVIDQDYRGNVGVILFNHGDEDFHISEGDRVAQLICEKISYAEVEEVESLDETKRGDGGFGSTGIKS